MRWCYALCYAPSPANKEAVCYSSQVNCMPFEKTWRWSVPKCRGENHRTTEYFGLEVTIKDHLFNPPCKEHGHLQLDQLAHSSLNSSAKLKWKEWLHRLLFLSNSLVLSWTRLSMDWGNNFKETGQQDNSNFLIERGSLGDWYSKEPVALSSHLAWKS